MCEIESKMKIKSTKLGEIEVEESSILTFVKPILGYSELTKFVLVNIEGNDIFSWLQSVEDLSLAFPVSVPAYFNIDYKFEIKDEDAEVLGLTDGKDVLSFNIVTIPKGNPKSATINLLAPIVVNKLNKKAMQLVLSNSALPSAKRIF